MTTSLRRLLCKALIRPHFDYACTAWHPNLCRKLKNKIQTTQNKCARFCINLDKMAHISQNEFEKLNGFPISDIISQCILSTTFNFVNDIGPNNMNEVFQWAAESNRTLRNYYHFAKQLLVKILSFLGPSKWNQLPESLKKGNNINTFKHNLKKTLSGRTCKLSQFINAIIIGSNNI